MNLVIGTTVVGVTRQSRKKNAPLRKTSVVREKGGCLEGSVGVFGEGVEKRKDIEGVGEIEGFKVRLGDNGRFEVVLYLL